MQLIAVCSVILTPDTAHRNLAIFTALAGAPLVLIRFLSIHQHIPRFHLFSLPFALLINFGVLRMYCWCYRETVNLWMIQLRISRIIEVNGKGTQGYATCWSFSTHCFLHVRSPTHRPPVYCRIQGLDHFFSSGAEAQSTLHHRPTLWSN
jgi:hypothetical protein